VKEAKLLERKLDEFGATINDMLRQGWEIVNIFPMMGWLLFSRDVATPTPDTPISTTPTIWTFGDRLRWLRWERDLTLADLSSATGLSISYLSDMERGRTLPTLATLYKLAAAYDMTASDLLRGVEIDEGEKR